MPSYRYNQLSGDDIFRQQLALNGCDYVEVPIHSTNLPTVAAIKHGNFTTVVGPTGDVFQTQNLKLSSGNVINNGIQPQVAGGVVTYPLMMEGIVRPYPPTRISDIMPDGWTIGCAESKKPLLGPLIECRLPRADPKIREGLRIVAASEVERLDMALLSPGKETADILFNDSLFTSLQADISPQGANALDDYLRQHQDARMRTYLNAVIGNQGCHCQRGDLDRFLEKEKAVASAIALRATLSEECRLRMQEPLDVQPYVDHVRVMRGIVETWDKYQGDLLSKSKPLPRGPWDAPNGDADLNIS